MTIPKKILEADYESVRQEFPEHGLKPYSELTDEEKSNHEKIFRETTSFFESLGEAVRLGNPLPNPFKPNL